jgi:serine/threonine-protein kinase
LKSRGPQEESLVIDIGIAIAGALEFMQQQGLVHRDIKPDNIMLCNDGSIKLMDLGLAKATTGEITSLTAPGMAIGTPVYMSPEHIKGARNLDIRTDIYGLGATMYHAITGQKPFEGDNPFQIMYKKTEQPPPNPKGRRKDMSENLATIIQICMAREKEDRYANPKELVADLNLIKQGHAPRKRLPGAPAPAPVSATSPQPKAPTGSVRAAGATPLPARKKSPAGMIMAVIVILLLLAAGAIAYVKFVKKGRIPGLGHRISVPS